MRAIKINSKKRLCILMQGHWNRIMGGSQYQAKCIIEEVAKTRLYDIFFLTRECLNNNFDKEYKLIKYSYPGAYWRGTHRLFLEMIVLPKILKKISPDIIYQRVGCAQTGIAAHFAIKNGCKMVWHIACDQDVKPESLRPSRYIFSEWVERKILDYGIKNATHIIAQTKDQKLLLAKHYQRVASAVIPNLHPLPKENIEKTDPIKIVWVANLKALKQPEVFIRLAEDLQHIPNVKFIMIGALQGNLHKQNYYLNMIHKAKTLDFLGYQSLDTVNRILASSHIFVNTSLYEGFPNTFIQAWMRQLPVVSLTVDPDQIIANQRLGYVSGTFSKLKNDVIELVRNNDLRSKIGAKAQNFALRMFSLKNSEMIVQLFER